MEGERPREPYTGSAKHQLGIVLGFMPSWCSALPVYGSRGRSPSIFPLFRHFSKLTLTPNFSLLIVAVPVPIPFNSPPSGTITPV